MFIMCSRGKPIAAVAASAAAAVGAPDLHPALKRIAPLVGAWHGKGACMLRCSPLEFLVFLVVFCSLRGSAILACSAHQSKFGGVVRPCASLLFFPYRRRLLPNHSRFSVRRAAVNYTCRKAVLGLQSEDQGNQGGRQHGYANSSPLPMHGSCSAIMIASFVRLCLPKSCSIRVGFLCVRVVCVCVPALCLCLCLCLCLRVHAFRC